MKITAQEAAKHGFHFGPGFRGFITAANLGQLAQDAALVTTPNTAVPVELAAYFDPIIIDILTAARKARSMLPEVKKGDWATPYAKFRINELTGATEPYSDYAHSRTSGANYNWANRENYIFQTVIQYGDLEEATTATAKISLASDKQRAVANTIDMDSNKFYLQGVAGREIFGILNDPSLPAPIAPAPSGAGSSPLWANKTTQQKYEDVLLLFQSLVNQAGGHIDKDSPLVLSMSPGLAVELGSATDFNVSVWDMLKKYFANLELVTVPELYSSTTGETMILHAKQVLGMKSGELAYSEKARAGRLVPDLSSFAQKWTAGTYGAIIYLPFAFGQMRGM